MKAAAKRKMEFEKLQERKIQVEREKEGDLWSDKEVFVTTAYRKKMEGSASFFIGTFSRWLITRVLKASSAISLKSKKIIYKKRFSFIYIFGW